MVLIFPHTCYYLHLDVTSPDVYIALENLVCIGSIALLYIDKVVIMEVVFMH